MATVAHHHRRKTTYPHTTLYIKPEFPAREGFLSPRMINGTADQTAQIVYKKIIVTSLVLFSLLLLRNTHQRCT